jgi:hypothetical protein
VTPLNGHINPQKLEIQFFLDLNSVTLPDLVQTWDICNIEKFFIGFWDFNHGTNMDACWSPKVLRVY